MTFVGKILVIVIMAFALLFLGISTVVFTTATNWKDATAKERTKKDQLQKSFQDVQATVEAKKKEYEQAKSEHTAAVAQNDSRIKALENDVKTLNDETTSVRTNLEKAQQNAVTALAEAAERRKETEQLREQKSAVEKQSNEYKLQQTDLNDKIRELERQTKTLDDNNKDLRDRVGRFSTLLRRNGLSDDISVVKALETPPPVKGEVLRVDPMNKRVELTIGSDDGLAPGHILYIYRTNQYLGQIQVQSVDPDQSVAKVVGRTINGLKLKEGDFVSSTIRPRG